MAKQVLRHMTTFILTLFVCTIVLTLINCIPQNAIKKNVEDSTNYLTTNPASPTIIKDSSSTQVDNYADIMLINVIYNVDSTHPFTSAISDKYYRIDNNNASDDLYSSVILNKSPQNEYSRYWHGMQIFLRPLLTLFPLAAIRSILGIFLLALNIWLCTLLFKRKYYGIMGIYIASLLIVDFWMCAFTIEYISIFLLIAVLGIIMLYTECKHIDTLFIISGALTCYFDFLTAETLTFTIPLILYLLIQYKNGKATELKASLKKVIKLGLCWLFSYAFMFAFKWALVYLICGKSSFIKALTAATVRINGSVLESDVTDTLSKTQLIRIILLRNLGCLFHLRGTVVASSVIIVGIIVLLICFSYFYLFRKKEVDSSIIITLLLIGLIPFLRFILLQNHSCLHYFFTYRALMASVFSILGIFYTSTDLLQFNRKRKK